MAADTLHCASSCCRSAAIAAATSRCSCFPCRASFAIASRQRHPRLAMPCNARPRCSRRKAAFPSPRRICWDSAAARLRRLRADRLYPPWAFDIRVALPDRPLWLDAYLYSNGDRRHPPSAEYCKRVIPCCPHFPAGEGWVSAIPGWLRGHFQEADKSGRTPSMWWQTHFFGRFFNFFPTDCLRLNS